MTGMLNTAPQWSHARGNAVVLSRWQATAVVTVTSAVMAGSPPQQADRPVDNLLYPLVPVAVCGSARDRTTLS